MLYSQLSPEYCSYPPTLLLLGVLLHEYLDEGDHGVEHRLGRPRRQVERLLQAGVHRVDRLVDVLEVEPQLAEQRPPLAGLVGPQGLDDGVLDAAARVHEQRLELGLQVVYC